MYAEVFGLQADLYKALANSRRLEIIHLLRDQELSVGEMMEMLGLPQANVSQHLHVLRKNNLVRARREGKEIYYQLGHPNLIAASDLIRELLVDEHQVDDELVKELRLRMKDLVPVVKDPVCRMRISPKTASYAVKHDGEMIYFCAEGCKERFVEKPESYI